MTFNLNTPGIDCSAADNVQLAQVVTFLEKLTNDLNYHLNHLDQSNFSETLNQKLKEGGIRFGE